MKHLRGLMLLVALFGAGVGARVAHAWEEWSTFRVGYVASEDAARDAQRRAFEARIQPLEDDGRWSEVIAESQEEQKAHPDNPGGPFAEALGRYYQGDIAGAIVLWDKAREMAPAWVTKIDRIKLDAKSAQYNFPKLVLRPLSIVQSDEARDRALYSGKGRALLQAKKFDEIENVANELQASKATDISGRALLESFFEGLTSVGEDALGKREQIAAWRKARPQSNLARLAAVMVWVNVGWEFRGHAFANTVPQEDWKGMSAALERAAQGLKALPATAFFSPLAFTVTLDYELLANFPHDQRDDVAAQGLKRFPSFQGIYTRVSKYRQTKWGGEPGEVEAFIEERADEVGGEEGDIFYARLAWSLLAGAGSLWDYTTLSYPRFQKGMKALELRHPGSLSLRNAVLMAAIQKRDYGVVQTYFAGPQGNIIDERWDTPEYRLYISRWRMWILSLNVPAPKK